ncbi:diguanylate cyclase/phosphodiesterase with PAS/PAC sensor [Geminocystis sp. NIES-3708]|uniref:EAL domain-containing protein n=1 Tax=Geminocystis sp. NIES-3708 TaxID=1615909 RepID=UPI0005FCC3D3|nr:EAL domain-containing protein [Geminocystis sp. NIES-3708]BAQ60577.1 diguanylate cyclase/phosphodiesterase with PAS/PAC sensor [Geminocystis sp. NIES-3708]
MSEVQEFRHIFVIEDRKGRRIVSLEESNYTLGRDSHNPIILYDYQVSRTHATLIRRMDDEGDGFSYRIIDGDLQGKRSTNGILINGHASISHELKHGDTIRFANEAKANYYIIPTDSGIDLFNPDGLDRINASRTTLTNQSSETMIGKQTESSNPEDQQELIRLASFPELSPNPIIELDWDGNITYLNPAASIKFDTIYDEKLDHPILSGLLTEYNNRQGNLFLREVKIGTEVFEQYVHYLSEKKLIRCYIFDFTKRKQAESQLKESEARYRAIARQTSEGILLAYASNKRIIEANDSYLNLLGYSSEEITNLTLYNVIASDLTIFNQDLINVLENKEDFTKQYLHRCQDGSLINLDSSVSLISYQNKDIFCFVVKNATTSENIAFSSDQLFHDYTTHLPNQRLFNEQLTVAIANAERYQYLMGLIVAEIGNFKEFKEKNNQENNEKLIKSFAQTIQSCLRIGDLIARWDENKFMVLFPRIKGPRDPAKIAKKMSSTLEQFLQEYSSNVSLTLNINLGIYPIDGDELSLLIKNSLLSLEQNKTANNSSYGVTGFTISPKTASLLKLENLIGSAIKEQQFFLCYQPQIDTHTTKLTGLEALLRWDHPELGKVTPRHFLRLTEETDFMLPLGVWILQTVMLQMEAWEKQNISPLPIGVNISARQFSQPNFVETIEKILEQTTLPPQLLELEITENSFLQNPELAYKTLAQLSSLKVRLCFDNFGSGNSSLIYLQKVAFDTVKISPSLINLLEENVKNKAFIQSMAVLCQGYGTRLVAVGVEKLEQMELIRDLGCTEIQGNLFSRPLPAKDATIFLHKAEHSIIN